MAAARKAKPSVAVASTDAVLRSLSHDLKEPIRSIRKRIEYASNESSEAAFATLISLDERIEDIGKDIKNFRQQSKVVAVEFHEIELFISEEISPKVETFSDDLDRLTAASARANSSYRANLAVVEKHFRRFRRRVATIFDYARARGAIKRTNFGLHNEIKRVTRDMERLFRDVGAYPRSRGYALINADQIKIALALQNLLENAVKYRRKDVTLHIEIEILNLDASDSAEKTDLFDRIPSESENASRYWTFLEVRDNGRGVSKEDEARLFEMFFRSRESFEAGDDGSGLGLSIVQEIVRAHGGFVGVRSKLGEGSKFWFALPQETNPALLTEPSKG